MGMDDGLVAPVVDYAGPGTPGPRGWLDRVTSGPSLRAGVIIVLMIGVFWPVLWWLIKNTAPYFGDANWQHSYFVPAIGLYYLYLNREALAKAELRPMLWGALFRRSRLWVGAAMALCGAGGWRFMSDNVFILSISQWLTVYGILVLLLDWGLATTILGLLSYAYGIYPGQNKFTQGMGLVMTIFGLVWLMCGWDVMKIAWFPILFLACAIPWPELMYSRIAMPLQEWSASAAAWTLRLTGVDADRMGTKLFIGVGVNRRVLNVAEACAGLKSLMTFITLAGAMGFLSSRVVWQRIVITLSAIPIAILCNMIRVSGQGLLDHYVSQKLSESFAHQFVGLVMLIPAFFLIQLVGWVLENMFVEEADKRAIQERSTTEPDIIVVPRSSQAPRRDAPLSAAPAAATDDLAAATQRLISAGSRRSKASPAPRKEEAP